MATILTDRRSILDDRMAIYTGAFVLGAAASVFVGYTAIFLSKSHYNLTLAQYGVMFLPEFLAVVVATQFAAPIACRCRAELTYAIGLGSGLVGMALLIAANFTLRLPVSYPLLLASSAFVGAGLGLSFPFVRCYAVSLRPLRSRRQVLLVNALLAAGVAASPAYALATMGSSAWWSLPVLLAALLIAGLLRSQTLRAPPDGTRRSADRRSPGRLHAYPGLALLYGVCAIVCISAAQSPTTSTSPRHFPLLALVEVGFWPALLLAGRVVFALIDGMDSRQRTASIGVFMIAIIVLVISASVPQYDMMHVGIYLLAIIACAALLPIDTRPGNEYVAIYPLTVTVGLMVLFPMLFGLSELMFPRFAAMGITPAEIFAGDAALGAIVCILLLPIILNWPTMGYFDKPALRSAGPPGAGYSGNPPSPGALSAPLPRRPSEHPPAASGSNEQGGSGEAGGSGEPGGATALPPRSPAGPGGQSE